MPPDPDLGSAKPGRRGGRWLFWWNARARAREILHLDDEPWKIAGGLGAGVFIAFTPYYGLHTLMALAAAFCFRLNVAAALAGSWIVVPPAIPFVMAFCLRVGWALVGRPHRAAARGGSAAAMWARMAPHLWPLVVGSTMVGLVVAVVAYVVAYQAVLRVRAARAGPTQVAESKPSDAEFQLDKPEPPV